MPVSRTASLSHTLGKGRDVFSRRRMSRCGLLTHEATENLGRELSQRPCRSSIFTKKVEENLFFLKDSHELGCVSRRNCTIILKLLILPIKYRLALRHSAHFVSLLSTLPTAPPLFFLTAPVSYCVPHIRHFMKSPAPAPPSAFFFSKANSRRRPSRRPRCYLRQAKPSREDFFDRKTRLKGKLPRPHGIFLP